MAFGILVLNCESYFALKLALDSRVLALVSRVQALALRVLALALALSTTLIFVNLIHCFDDKIMRYAFLFKLHYYKENQCILNMDFYIIITNTSQK